MAYTWQEDYGLKLMNINSSQEIIISIHSMWLGNVSLFTHEYTGQ